MTVDSPLSRLTNDYPVELEAPDISRYATGTGDIPYVHTFRAAAPGPHVALTALVHGNELCGAIALDRLLREGVRPVRGTLSFAFVNTEAYARYDPAQPTASRWVDEDGNRVWSPEALDGPRDSVELRRARELRGFVDTIDLLLDIHSMQERNLPLMLAGPAVKGRRLARALGAPALIVADAGHAAGRRLRDYGGFADPASDRNALLMESGQHWEAAAAAVALDTAARFLHVTGAVAPDALAHHLMPDPAGQRVIEVTDRVTIESEAFTFARPFRGLEVLPDAGTLIGHDGERPVASPHDDCVLVMPSRRLWRGQTAVRLGRYIED